MSVDRVVIVGAGLAGSRCAESLRAEGFTGWITLLGDERHAPYSRPALSKDLLAGSQGTEHLSLRPPDFWAEQGIDLRLADPVVDVDPARRTVRTRAGSTLEWDALVVATGARPASLRALAGRPAARVLRTLDDAEALRSAIGPGVRLAVVGGGFVGAEVASAAIEAGCEVTLVEALAAPLERTLGREVGMLLAERWRGLGLDVRLDRSVVRASTPRAAAVRLHLSDGSHLEADRVVASVGAAPAGDLFEALGVELAPDGRIRADAGGRTSRPGIHACGDAASTWHPTLGAHLPGHHWTGAAAEGAAAAHSILGRPAPPRALPYVWSDQFGLRLQQVGDPSRAARVEIDGSPDAFRARYLDATGRLRAALVANVPQELAALREEISATFAPSAYHRAA